MTTIYDNTGSTLPQIPTNPPPFFPLWPWPQPRPIEGAERSIGGLPFGDGDPLEALESVYGRPDVRSAIATGSAALTEVISNDPAALDALDDLLGGRLRQAAEPRAEREVVTVVLLTILFIECVVLGGIVGAASRPPATT